MTGKTKRLFQGLIVFLWMAGGTAYYFVNHKPFSPSTAFVMGSGLYNLLTALLITGLAGAVGRWLIRSIGGTGWHGDVERAARRSPVARAQNVKFVQGSVVQLVLEAAIGFGVLALGFLLFGSTVGTPPLVIWAVTLLLFLVLRKDFTQWLHQWQGLGVMLRGQTRLTQSIMFTLALILFLTLLTALAPPVKFDALVYHLTLPDLYLTEGRVFYPLGNVFWGMPQTIELLYTWAMTLAGPPAAVALSWIMAGLSLIGTVSLLGEVYTTRVGWTAGGILLSGFTLAISTAWGYVDWGAFLFGFGFFVWLTRWYKKPAGMNLIMAGLMAGVALGTKYTAGLLLPAGFLVVLLRTRERGNILRSIFIYGAPAILATLPWWGKNYLATGNPFYPLLLPGGEMDSARLAFYQDHAPWGGWLDVALLPVRATYLGLEGGPGYGASIGPFFLVFGGLAFFHWRVLEGEEKGMVHLAGLIAGFGLLIWVIAGRASGLLTQTRLYLAIFPAIVFLTGAGFNRLSQFNIPGVRLGRIAQILVALVLSLNAIQVAGLTLQMGAIRYHFGLMDRQSYLENNLGWYARAMETILALPQGGRVLTLWEPRGFYCNPRCESDEVLDRWVHAMRTGSSLESLRSSWAAAGFSHLLVYKAGADFIRRDDRRYEAAEWEALDEFLGGLPLEDAIGGTYELYRLGP